MPKGYYGWDLIDGEEGANLLKSALHNLSARNRSDDQYCQGLVVGVVSALMAGGMEFENATKLVWQLLPEDFRSERIPVCWQDRFQPKRRGNESRNN